jgi:hypothetical protein
MTLLEIQSDTIKMTREIPETVGDNIDSGRILLMTKLILRVTKLPDPTLISLSLRNLM